jgi:hypothetical protein
MLIPLLQGCFGAGNPKLQWVAPIASESTPIVQNGSVYVTGFHAGHPGEAYRLFALDASNGKEKWASADSVKEVYGESGGYVFYSNAAGHLVQLDAATGTKKYESTDDGPQILHWALRGDTMYVINGAFELVAIDNRQSKVLWRTQLPFQAGDDTALEYAGQTIIVSGNFRNAPDQFGMIWALNPANGAEIWHFEAPPPHDFAPLTVLVHAPYILATNTSPLGLKTHVLDLQTGKERYPSIPAFDFYGCYQGIAYAPGGAFDLRTGQQTAGKTTWIISSIVYNGIAWQRKIGSVGTGEAFLLRTTYDGDFRGNRNWTDTPPNSWIEGTNISTGKSAHKTKECKYTRFSAPVEAGSMLFHTSIALMKEGKSGVWAYQLPKGH